jgi:hypothetical protein
LEQALTLLIAMARKDGEVAVAISRVASRFSFSCEIVLLVDAATAERR